MARNSYLGIARLATHPAWSSRRIALVCPVCGGEHLRVRDYDRDFLGHEPEARTAYFYLSAKTYERLAPERGWPPLDEASMAFNSSDPRKEN